MADPTDTAFLGELTNELKEFPEKLSKIFKENFGPSELFASAYKQASEQNKRQQDLIQSLGQSSDTFKNLYSGVEEINKSFYGMTAENGEALSSIFENQGTLLEEYHSIIDSNLLRIQTTQEKVSAKEIADLTLYGRALGYREKQTQDFLERQFSLTGEVNNELLKQSLAYSKAIETSTGISSKIIAENISSMMSDVSSFGNMTVEEMSEAAAAISKVGLEVSDLSTLVDKFSTFDKAADAVSKLTQVFGVQMDSMRYMDASFESPEEMFSMIREDFEMAGVSMSDMGLDEKRVLSSVTGLDISSLERLLGEAGSGLSQFTDQVSGSTAGVDAPDIDNSLANANDNIGTLNQMSTSLESAAEAAAVRASRATTAAFSEGVKDLTNQSTLLFNQGIRTFNIEAVKLKNTVMDTDLGVLYEKSMDFLVTSTEDMREFANELSHTTTLLESLAKVLEEKMFLTEPELNTSSSGGTESQSSVPNTFFDSEGSSLISRASKKGDNKDSGTIQLNLDKSLRPSDVASVAQEFQASTDGKMSKTEMEQFSKMIAAAIANNPTAPINIEIKDTGEAFEYRLNNSAAVQI